MDASTQKMLLALGTTVLRKGLTVGGTAAASHGVIAGNQVETFVSVGLALAGVAWSFWNDYGSTIVLSKLEVWKATALAQRDALRQAKIAPPTAAQIADKVPDPKVTAEVVTKTMAAG